jgi:hypothetical protein
MVRIGKDVRRLLDKNGLRQTESHVNEWNINLSKGHTGPQHQASMESAAFTACALMYMQDAPVDLSFYYTGNAGNMGSFEPDGAYRKKAYALKALGTMLDTRARLKVSGGDTEGVAVLAGRSSDKHTVQVLIANYRIEQPQGPPKQTAAPGSHGLERRKLRATPADAYALELVKLPWGNAPFLLKRYRLDRDQDFTLMEQRGCDGGVLRLAEPLAPPALELIVTTSAASRP